jgi:hypothetical protein
MPDEASETLIQKLRDAVNELDCVAGSQRRVAMFALNAVIEFFLSEFKTEASKSLLVPLTRLNEALGDLDDGVVAPMLQPVPRPAGRLREASEWDTIRALAVFTSDQLHKTGLRRPTADLEVANILSNSGITLKRGRDPVTRQPKSVTARTVGGWRETTVADIGRQSGLAQQVDGLSSQLSELATCTEWTTEERRAKLCSTLADLIRRYRPSEIVP